MSAPERDVAAGRAGSPGSTPLGRSLALAVGVTAAGMIPAWLVGGLAVQMRDDLRFDAFQLGATTSLFHAVSALVSLPGSRVVERIGWRRGIAVTSVLSSLGLAGVAVAARTWSMLLVALVVLAVGNSTAQPSANLLLARTVPSDRRGLAFGVKQAAVPFASMSAGLAVPLLAVTVGWRWAFGAAAVIGPLLLVALPSGTRSDPLERGRRVKLGGEGDAPARALWQLAISVGFATAATTALGSFMVSSTVDQGMDPAAAGWLFAGASGVGLVIRVVAGWRADRRDGGHLRFCILMMLGGSLGFLLFALGGPTWTMVVAATLCFGLGWAWNGVFIFAVMEVNKGAPAAATGVIMVVKFVGATGGPLLFGLLVSQVSYRVAWTMGAGLMVLAATQMQVARRELRRSRTAAPAADAAG